MANEHVLMTQKSFPISMTCAVGTGIEKGAVLTMSDPNTAAAATAEGAVFAGIAYTEKIASNGMIHISVLTGPGDELRASASGSIAIGDTLMIAGNTLGTEFNWLAKATAGLSGGHIVGVAKEAAAVTETFKYVLLPGASS